MRRRWWLIGVVLVASAIMAGIFALTGPFSYVSTRGASMEPSFQQGDLVLIRTADIYQVGDVVAYHSQLLDTVVMHRIIERDGDQYLFKGDNNSWIDPDEPTRAELIGTSWLRVPHVGSALSWIRSSWALFPPIALVIASLVPTRMHRRRKPGTPVRSSRTVAPSPRTGRIPQQLLPAAAAGLIAFVGLGFFAYTRPITQTQPSTVDYTQQGGFSYSATTPPGPVYGTEGVTTGDPLFLQLVTKADVRFTYQFETSADAQVAGTIALSADVSDPAGWNRSVELSPPTEFRGETAEAVAALDVDLFETMIAEIESLTGVSSATHTVTVNAHVQVEGTVAGQTLQEAFEPGLVFQLDALQLRPALAVGAATEQDPLAPSELGSVVTTSSATGQLSVRGYHLAVSDARILALAGAIGSTIALAIGLIAFWLQRRDENARIHAKHGHRIIQVDPADGDAARPVVDVTTMADLARLAEQYGCLILHQEFDGTHSYMFQVDRTVYRYGIGNHEPIDSWPPPLNHPPDSYEVTARSTGAALQR